VHICVIQLPGWGYDAGKRFPDLRYALSIQNASKERRVIQHCFPDHRMVPERSRTHSDLRFRLGRFDQQFIVQPRFQNQKWTHGKHVHASALEAVDRFLWCADDRFILVEAGVENNW
jgi:hypothetical protein